MDLAQFLASLIVIVVMINVILGGVAYLILLERKIASWAQDRIGPNRVGPYGLFQPIADGLKFLFKEDYNPSGVDRALFMLAPVMAAVPAMIGWAVIPWGGIYDSAWGLLRIIGADVSIGVLYILAIGSLAVYGVVVGAWASNNKYSFLGGLRATAQMLSYEIPLALTVLCVVLMAGTIRTGPIVNTQADYWFFVIPQWFIFQQPLAAVIFLTCILAEANRAPFDLAEAEQELVGGYHTEYSSMKFALYFLGEYMHMITSSAFLVLLFLGGWHVPWLDYLFYGGPQPVVAGILGVLLKVAVYLFKVFLVLSLMMWIRWTLPRFRFDQLMRLAWRIMIPTSLLLLLMTAGLVFFGLQNWAWLGNIVVLALVIGLGAFIPQGPPINRRVRLAGSRFSPLPTTTLR